MDSVKKTKLPLMLRFKREFPVLFKAMSVWIATPLLGMATLLYLDVGISQPASSSFPVGLAAVGLSIGLAAACFTMSPIGIDTDGQYAGEKFLHAALLLIQTLFVLYVRDAATALPFISPNGLAVAIIKIVANTILTFVTAPACWCWYYGFSELNETLWNNWEKRIKWFNTAITTLRKAVSEIEVSDARQDQRPMEPSEVKNPPAH